MDSIIFDKSNLRVTFSHAEKTFLYLEDLNFETQDTNWFHRLSMAFLKVSIICLHKEEEIVSYSQPISLGGYMGPYLTRQIFNIRWIVGEGQDFLPFQNLPIETWQISVELAGIELREDEKIHLKTYKIDKSFVQRRVQDWRQRIVRLYNLVSEWISQDSSFMTKEAGNVPMHEGLMKTFNVSVEYLPILSIQDTHKPFCYLRPIGLWIPHTNGRIDIIAKETAYLLIDPSNLFQLSQWKIFPFHNRNNGIELTPDSFLKIINQIHGGF